MHINQNATYDTAVTRGKSFCKSAIIFTYIVQFSIVTLGKERQKKNDEQIEISCLVFQP